MCAYGNEEEGQRRRGRLGEGGAAPHDITTHITRTQEDTQNTLNRHRAVSFTAFLYSRRLWRLFSQGWLVDAMDVDVDGSTGGDLHKGTKTAQQDTA